MPRTYPVLDDKLIHRTYENQSDTESFVGSPKASSTPKGSIQRATSGPVKEDETILAGYTERPNSVLYCDEHTHTNTSIVHSLFSPDEYVNTFDDFKRCCGSGGWFDFLTKHHLRILFMILIAMVSYSIWINFTQGACNRQDMWSDYRKELRLLRNEYPALSKPDENALLVVGQQWIIDARSDPVVLTVGGPNALAFTEKLSKILAKISRTKPRQVINADSNISRAELHKLVKSELKSHTMPYIALRSIDRLSWDSPLVIQAFSDPDSFSVSNSFLLLSMEDSQTGARTCEADISEQLINNWTSSGGNMDNVTPIISRILGYTICI